MIYPIRIVCVLPFAMPRVYTKELLLLVMVDPIRVVSV